MINRLIKYLFFKRFGIYPRVRINDTPCIFDNWCISDELKYLEDEDMVSIEPVVMTTKELKSLPEFMGW